MAATRVYLVRHGATELSTEDRFAGAIDVLLSAAGCEQARLLGQRLVEEKLCSVYASPMKRTIATAELIAAPQQLAVETVAELREIAHGRWEGKTRKEVEAEFPEEYARYETDPYSFAPLGGESGLQVTARALPALLQLVDRNAGKRLLSSLLGFDPRKYRARLDQSPAALNILDFKDAAHPRLTLFNDTSHYDRMPNIPQGRLSKVWSA